MTNKEVKLMSSLANISASLGFKVPVYEKPHFWQLKRKAYLKYLNRHKLPYTLKADG